MDHSLHRAVSPTYALSESTDLFALLTAHSQIQRTPYTRRQKAIPRPIRLCTWLWRGP